MSVLPTFSLAVNGGDMPAPEVCCEKSLVAETNARGVTQVVLLPVVREDFESLTIGFEAIDSGRAVARDVDCTVRSMEDTVRQCLWDGDQGVSFTC